MIRNLLGLLIVSLTCALSAHAESALDIMPMPQHVEANGFRLPVGKSLTVYYSNVSSTRLQQATERVALAWQTRMSGEMKLADATEPKALLVITCDALSPDIPAVSTDESYSLDINAKRAVLHAANEIGVLRGLSTIQQLLSNDKQGWFIPGLTIKDAPRFSWRGLLIDSGRHFMPVGVIYRNLDAMALVKLNVLHFHLTEDQGFRIEIKRHPELTAQGSDGKFYTQQQIKEIVAYAANRGIRVVPELDMPAHTVSWLVSHPEFTTGSEPVVLERRWGGFNPVFDPTNESVYTFVNEVLDEVTALFPDPFFHVGGDENNGVQWTKSESIQAFIKEHGLKNNSGLQTYFNQRLGKILDHYNKRMIGWDEILNPELPHQDVIEAWRGEPDISKATKEGYDVIRAHNYYIDLQRTTVTHYLTDPEPQGSVGNPGHVLGGEATMWGEFVNEQTIDSRIWPRTAAIAERFWSERSIKDVDDMYRRLDYIDLRLDEVGTQHKKYVRQLLEHLIGSDHSKSPLEVLENFVDACEPLPGLPRKGITSVTPLNTFPDVVRADGKIQRHFSYKVGSFLNSKTFNEASGYSITLYLLKWKSSASLVLKIAKTSPALADAATLAYQLNDAAAVGLEAINYIKHGQAATDAWKQMALKRLKLDSEVRNNVKLAIIPSVENLVNTVKIQK